MGSGIPVDWLEEKIEKLTTYIRNLSFRKAMVAYILVSAVIVYGLSYLTMILCWQWEIAEWMKYEQEGLESIIYQKGPVWGYHFPFAQETDNIRLMLLDFTRVWCPYFYAFAGMIVTIFIFYRRRLASPLKILKGSVARIRGNDLDFHVHYDSRDELGSLCDSVEDMRMELVRGKEEMWLMVERQKELNAAFAHDLRTPLTVLRGYTDLLARYIPEGKISGEKMTDTLSLMSDHLRRLEDYSRTMKGIRSIEEVPFAPERIRLESLEKRIREVVFALGHAGDVRILYQGCGLTDTAQKDAAGSLLVLDAGQNNAAGSLLILDAAQEREASQEKKKAAVWVEADSNIIMEVLENLLSNAIRYADTEIEVVSDYEIQKEEFLLVVRDDGKGFSDEQLKMAVKPYHKEYEGAQPDEHFGIGLHICREFCKKHGGTLDVSNSIRGGALVTASFYCKTEKNM